MRKLLLLVIPAMLLWGNNSNAQTALSFDGVDDYVNAGDNFNLTSYTKEVWINWDGVTGQNNVISGDLDNRHAFWAVGGNMRAGHGAPFSTVADPDDLVPGECYHFAVSYDGATGKMKLYKNGALIQQNFTDPGFVITKMFIAAFPEPNGSLNQFGGDIDDVRVWDYVRSDEEIADNYEAQLTGAEAGLVLYYDMEDGAGSSVASDLTGNGNDGELINMDIDDSWVESCSDEPVDPEPECIEITSFHPNPTWNKVYLNLNGSYNSLQVRVYNCYGYYVRGKYVSGPTDNVYATLRGLRRGYYYVMVLDCETWKYDYVRVYKRGWYC